MRFCGEAEQSVIGTLMLNNKKLDDVLEIISSADFYRVDCKLIFEAMIRLHEVGSPFDVITLSESMQLAGTLEQSGGIGYLVEIANNTPSTANVKSYSRIVADRAMERKFTEAGQRICEIGESAEINVDDKINLIHTELAALERTDRTDIVDFDTLLKSELTDIDGKFRKVGKAGLDTGFNALDSRFGGLEPSDLWILAARPAMGKTTLAMNIAYNVAAQGKEVLIFSLEMSKEQLTKRLVSSASSIPYSALRTGDLYENSWPKLSAGIAKLKGKKIHIVDFAGIDVNHALAIARKFARNGNLGLIVIDYLQLMTAKSESRFDEVSQVSRKLKAMAKTIGCPVLALSQLSREVEKRNPPIPNNSDLRESGQIEQDADIITFIYREEVYNQNCMESEKGIAKIITTKFRNGETGVDVMRTALQFSRFEDLNYEYVQAIPEEKKRRSGGFN